MQKKAASKKRSVTSKRPFEVTRAALERAYFVAEFGLEGECTSASEGFAHALGYTPSELTALSHKAIEGAGAAVPWPALSRGEVHAATVAYRKKDGAEVFCQASYAPLSDAKGRVTSVLLTATDVTAKKQRDEAIEKQSHHVRSTLDAATTNLMLADEKFDIIYMNESLVTMLKKNEAAIQRQLPNFRVDDILGKSIDRFHRDASHQRRLLAGLSGRHSVRLNLGNRLFGLTAVNCRAPSGATVGYAVEWADITDQVEAESRLAALNRTQAIIELAVDGRIITANENFLRVFGYSLDEVAGQHHRMLVDPSFASSPEHEAFWQKLGSGQPVADLFARVAKGARRVWLQASYNPVVDAGGKVVKVVAVGSDVTSAQNVAAENDGKMKAIGKAQAIVEYSLDGKVISANENFLKTSGYSLDEVVGQHHSHFCDVAFAGSPEYVAFWQKLNRGDYDAGTYRRIGKGGREFYIQASYNPILDASGRPFKVVQFASDVTAQQFAAAENTGKMQAIGKAQAVIEFSMDGTVLSANDNFLKTLGYSLDEVKGKHHRMFCDPSYTSSAEYTAFWQRLNRGDHDAGLYRRIGKGGRECFIQASYTPIFDMQGAPVQSREVRDRRDG